jgi:alkylhydroperoxidase family enzyme
LSYVPPPPRLPLFLRFLIGAVERRLGKSLLANRILGWYPRALVGSGVMEALVAHDEPEVPRRLLALVRMYTSFLVSCPFCIDMNSRDFQRKGITDEEVRALQGRVPLDTVSTFTAKEKAALRYVQCVCRTPLQFTSDVLEEMNRSFSPRGFVIVASTCAQVNFWTRLIQGLGVPPAGFSADCPILDLDAYSTLKRTPRSADDQGLGRQVNDDIGLD